MGTKEFFKKAGTVGTGHTLNFVINNWFDYLVYVPVIAFLGPIYGCGAMIVLSVILNLTLIWVYDTTGKDWLGFEAIKEGKEKFSSTLPGWIQKLMSAGDWGAFIGLSLYDPFLATVYLRKQDQVFKGLSARDWKIFSAATILSNVGWTGLVYGGLEAIKSLVNLFL